MDVPAVPFPATNLLATPNVTIITGRHVLLSSAQLNPAAATLLIQDGTIDRILLEHIPAAALTSRLPELLASMSPSTDPSSPTVGFWDVGDLWIMPGAIDAHVHINQPGRTLWEGMATATRAAAAGGCTTIVDMPLNAIPPTTTLANAQAKVASVGDSCWVDVALWGGLVPGNRAELRPLLDFGVRGFKGFLIESGVDEFPMVEADDVIGAMVELETARQTHPGRYQRDAPLLFHAELSSCACLPPTSTISNRSVSPTNQGLPPSPIENPPTLEDRVAPSSRYFAATKSMAALPTPRSASPQQETNDGYFATVPDTAPSMADDPRAYATFLATRPPAMEVSAICEVITWLEAHPGVRGHIVHLSTADAVPYIRAAKARGTRLTVETCFHYLRLAAPDVPAGATQFKCCPPIRDAANREALWKALEDGVIDLVVSDHSPSTPDLKCPETGDFLAAWGGIASVQFGLSVLWTEARRRGHTPAALLRWLCEEPARHIQLQHRKGQLATGLDADLVVWDPHAAFTVTTDGIHFRHKLSPYVGQTLYGRVHHTFVRGQVAFTRGSSVVSLPRGSLFPSVQVYTAPVDYSPFPEGAFSPAPLGQLVHE